jgi:hypothetical protein
LFNKKKKNFQLLIFRGVGGVGVVVGVKVVSCTVFHSKKTYNHISEVLYPSDDESNRLRYFGQLNNGIPSGHGTMTWKDGQIYKGIKKLQKYNNQLL